MKNWKVNKALCIRLLLSGALIAFLFYSVEGDDVTAMITGSHFGYLLMALLIAIVDRIMMAYKWSILLEAKRIRIPLMNLTGTYLISSFLGLFLPATVGADALRAYAVSKKGYLSGDIISSILIERVVGIIALLVFVIISVLLSVFAFGYLFFDDIWKLFWLISIILVAIFLFIMLSLNESFLQSSLSLLSRWGIDLRKFRFADKVKEVYLSYKGYQDQMGSLGVFLGLSFVENLLPIFWTYYLALAFNIPVPLLYFFILMPIVLVLVRLPISLDGIGIQEGTFVYFLSLIGVDHSAGLLLGVASHVVAILSILPGGILYCFSGLSFINDVTKKQMKITEARSSLEIK